MDSSGNEESLTKELSHYYRDSLWAGKLTRCDFSDDRYHLTSYEGAGRRGSDDCDEGVGQTVPFYQVERVAVASGHLPGDLARMLFEKEGGKEEGKRKEKTRQDRGVEIEVAWHMLRVADCDDGARGLCDAILSLPALVGPDGAIRLAAKGMRAPLMPRALLDEGSGAQGENARADIPKERYFSALANLTPLLCMTMFRVPSEFSVWSRRFGSGHMFAGIDLLIVDEAGQVSTPVGAASFALARRAVAMGDVEQIPPVWSFEPDEDERRMRALFELGEDEAVAPVTWLNRAEAWPASLFPNAEYRYFRDAGCLVCAIRPFDMSVGGDA